MQNNHLDISTFERQTEARLLVLDEMKGHLGVSFLL